MTTDDRREFGSFEEFWPSYVRLHAHDGNRSLHLVGTTLVIALTALSVLLGSPGLLLLLPIAGYGFAWAGHFLLQKNRPATFQHPLWSLRADFRMFWLSVTGRMPEEITRALSAQPSPEDLS